MIRKHAMRTIPAVLALLAVTGAVWAQREAPRDRPPAREAERRPEHVRHERPDDEPQIIVLRFEHIPAVSFLQVIEQLMEAEPMRELREELPRAVNEPANAVVLIAPPEVAERFEQLADQLDRPSGFHERMRDREMADRRRETPPRPPMPPQGSPPRRFGPAGGPSSGIRGRFGGFPGAGRPGMGRPTDDQPSPVKMMIGKLLSPEIGRKLELHREQIEKIRQLAGEFQRETLELRERIGREIRDVEPGQREEMARRIGSEAKERFQGLGRELHERIMQILGPEQREAAMRLFHPGERPPHGDRPTQERDYREERPRGEAERQRHEVERERDERERHEAEGREVERERHEAERREVERDRQERERQEQEHREAEDVERKHEPPHREGEREARPPHADQALSPEQQVMGFAERLLSRPAREKLRIDDRQAAQIKEIALAFREQIEQMNQRARRAVEEIDPKRRPEEARKLFANVREQIAKTALQMRERIVQALRPEQREALRRAFAADEGPSRKAPPAAKKPKPEPGKDGEKDKKEPSHR